tara:strand:- start:21 stop:380 length:360 start_codon:yes stop_codon:yes gene_type:complete
MKKSIKATLLSILIFPGAGHFLLKQYISGIFLAGTALIALGILMTKLVEIALQVAGKIQSGEIQYDVATIAELVSVKATGGEAQLFNFATMVLFITWLVGIGDSYRVGRAQEKNIGLGS